MTLHRWSWLALAWLALTAPGAADEEPGFRAIFNGRDLTGWEGETKYWRVEDGALTAESTAQNPLTARNTYLIWRQAELDDFELRMQIRLSAGNAGVQFRSRERPNFDVAGYQMDINADGGNSPNLHDEYGRLHLASPGERAVFAAGGSRRAEPLPEPERAAKAYRAGEWNDYRIVAQGTKLAVYINGVLASEVVDDDPAQQDWAGILALQIHGGEPLKVQYKDLRLKRLPLTRQKKLVLVAGGRSHQYGEHAFRAGCYLLKRCLDENVPGLRTAVYTNGWPQDPTALDNADAVVVYCDGGSGHPVNRHLDQVDALARRGGGVGMLHYGVEVPKGPAGERFLDWIGGYFEMYWSVNPTWKLENAQLAKDHPVTRGVQEYGTYDEWYYHMRLLDKRDGVTPILSALPPASTLNRPDGPHSGNPAVRAAVAQGEPQVVAWVRERPDGGRGFGFTGGHYHWTWAQDDNRRLVLNALCWLAKVDVPAAGVPSRRPTIEELKANQDFPVPAKFDFDALGKRIEQENAK